MNDNHKTKAQLIKELEDLRRQVAEQEKAETERRRAESVVHARLRMLTAGNKNTMAVDEFLQVALDEIEAQTGSTIGFCHFLEADQETLSLQSWSTNTLRNMCTAEGKGSHYPISKAGVWVDCVHERRPIIHNDFSTLPHRKGLPPGHAPVIRELVVPIMRDSRIVAIIGVGNKPSDYNKTDVDFALLLGDFSWEIVERKLTEEALQLSEDKFRLAFQANPDAITINRLEDGLYVDINQGFTDLTGFTREEVIGRTTRGINIWHDPADRKRLVLGLQERGFYDNLEAQFRRKDGSLNTGLMSARVLRLGEVPHVLSITRDISERKQMEEELRKSHNELEVRVQERTAELAQSNKELTIEIGERLKMEQALQESKKQLQILASKILSAQENERRRIALEVHDVLGSSLSAIKFKAEEALFHLPKDGNLHISKPLEALIPLIQDTIEEARRIQSDLRPSLLDDLGIVATLSWFCRRFESIYSGIKCERTGTIREEEVPDHLKITLFRIIQEAMNNIGKYAKADTVYLGLQKVDGAIELGIRDNGKGFDLESLSSRDSSKKGLGLSSMKERVEFSGGSFSIDSAKGEGTVIRAVWPI